MTVIINKPKDHYVKANGIKIRYWSAGNYGSTVILIHGLGGSAEIWLHNIAALTKDHTVFVPDLPGFGWSEQPPPSFCPFDYAIVIENFMRALNIQKASLIGHSLGGGIALHYAIQFPQKVKNLVLVDSAGFGRKTIWTLRLMSLPLIGEIVTYPTRLGVTLFFRFAVRNPAVITKEFVDMYYTLFNRPGFQAFLLKTTRMLVDIHGAKEEALAPIRTKLHEIKQPTLIVWGANDRVFPLQQAYAGKERMPHAHLHIMECCGHIPNLEEPEKFNNIVRNFFVSVNED